MSSFADLGVPAPLCAALARRGINEPFPIQAATLPDVLAGRDVAGKAPTGSGKTLAFGLAIAGRAAAAAPSSRAARGPWCSSRPASSPPRCSASSPPSSTSGPTAPSPPSTAASATARSASCSPAASAPSWPAPAASRT